MSLLGKLARGALAVSTFGTSEAVKAGYDYASKDGNILGKAQVTPTAPLDPNYFTYGDGPGSGLAQQIALAQQASGLSQQQGQVDREGAFYNQANGNFDIGNAAQMRQAGQIASDPQDQMRQLQALDMTGYSAGALNNTGNSLTALGTRPMGDSYVAAQLKQGLDSGMAQQLSMARTGRSLGSGQAAMGQAAFNNAALSQQTNQAAAVARIQEQNAYNQFQAQALGQAGQQYGAAGGLAGQLGNQATAIRTGNENVQLQNAQLNQGQQQLNNATTGIYNQLGTQQQTLGMQANQMGQSAQQYGNSQATHAIDQQAAANQSFATGNTAITQANNQAADKAAADKVAGDRALIKDGIQAAAAGGAASDERLKTNITPLYQGAPGAGLPGMWQSQTSQSDTFHPWADAVSNVSGKVQAAEAKARAAVAPSYAQALQAQNQAAAPGLRAPVDILNRVPGAGAGPSSSQSALLAFMQGQGAPHATAQPVMPSRPNFVLPNAQSAPPPRMFNGAVPQAPVMSDAHSKTRIAELEGRLAALQGPPPTASFAPAVDLTAAKPYAFDYKDPNAPGAAPGRQVGVMAQDLEHTAAANTVHDTPHGKMVDTGRLPLINTGAISELQKKVQRLEALGGGQAPMPAYQASLYPSTGGY